MDAIEPYDYGELTDFSLGYMPGYAAERPDIPADQEKERVGERMENSLADALEASVTGYDSVTPEGVSAQVAWGHVTYALLPVWLLHTQWEGKDYLFAMNGQTGRFVGDLPIDGRKAAAWFAGTFALMAAIIYVVGVAMEMEQDGAYWLILVAMSAVIAGIVLRILIGEMKTAKERHEASAYVTHADRRRWRPGRRAWGPRRPRRPRRRPRWAGRPRRQALAVDARTLSGMFALRKHSASGASVFYS